MGTGDNTKPTSKNSGWFNMEIIVMSILLLRDVWIKKKKSLYDTKIKIHKRIFKIQD